MALRVSAGNRPKLDEDGFVHGVIRSIANEESKEEHEWESLRWEIESEGTIRPMTFRIWTGLTYNPPDDKGEVSKLTRLCLAFGLLTVPQLMLDEVPEVDLEALIGQCVMFKLVREGGLYKIDLPTLGLDSDQQPLFE